MMKVRLVLFRQRRQEGIRPPQGCRRRRHCRRSFEGHIRPSPQHSHQADGHLVSCLCLAVRENPQLIISANIHLFLLFV